MHSRSLWQPQAPDVHIFSCQSIGLIIECCRPTLQPRHLGGFKGVQCFLCVSSNSYQCVLHKIILQLRTSKVRKYLKVKYNRVKFCSCRDVRSLMLSLRPALLPFQIHISSLWSSTPRMRHCYCWCHLKKGYQTVFCEVYHYHFVQRSSVCFTAVSLRLTGRAEGHCYFPCPENGPWSFPNGFKNKL